MGVVTSISYTARGMCFISILTFSYYAFKTASILRGTLYLKLLALGAITFIVTTLLLFADFFFGTHSSTRPAAFLLGMVGISLVSAGVIIRGIDLRKAFRISLLKTLLMAPPERFYILGIIMIVFVGLPSNVLGTFWLTAESDWIDILSAAVGAFSFAILAFGERTFYRSLREPMGNIKEMEIPLLRDDTAAATVYSTLTNSFLSKTKHAIGEEIVRDLLDEYFEHNPVLFGGCTPREDGTVDFWPLLGNVERMPKNDRLHMVCRIFCNLISKIILLYSRITSPSLAEKVLRDTYLSVKKQYGDIPIFFEVLRFLPEGFLEEEKLTLLNKEQLEAKVKERTKELEEAVIRAEDAARALQESKESFHNIVEKSADGIIVVDGNGIVRFVNPAAEILFGREKREFLGKLFDFAIGPGQTVEVDINRKSGEKGLGELRVIETDWGGKSARLVTLQDITDRKQAEEQLREYGLKLEEMVEERTLELKETLENLQRTQSQLLQSGKMASIGQLAAGVAHEINNPATFVNVNASTMQKWWKLFEPIFEKAQESNWEQELGLEKLSHMKRKFPEMIQSIKDGTERISFITKALRSFARPDHDEKKLVDIQQIFEHASVITQNRYKYHADLVTETAPDVPLIIGNHQRLEQVFVNLIMNASDAIKEKIDTMGQRDPPLRGLISITTTLLETPEKGIRLVIKDNGIGMDAEVKDKVFDPFFSTKPVGKGTGLGMSIVYGIIQDHNGSISVESTKGEGTAFTIALPLENTRGPTSNI